MSKNIRNLALATMSGFRHKCSGQVILATVLQ